MLEKLGCGFYLSFETIPDELPGEFNFSHWDISDKPLTPVRMVFNWHNFLSGCSTWRTEDWNGWIDQSQKMGYNTIMVHAYGNNPMAGFQFEGIDKPVGFLSSTQVGRDWSTNHVNDVRKINGGEVFDDPVFGCEAAIEGTDAEKTIAAQNLMASVFQHAEERGVDVYFAVDVDTTTANPQEMITKLPEHARFAIDVPAMSWMGQEEGKAWLPNPDTPEGYGYYKAQVAEFLETYPQIDCLVVWHRTNGTPWMAFTLDEMPPAWQEEYKAEIAKTPEAKKYWHSYHQFALAKVAKAFQKAVDDLGRPDVKIAYGSWRFDFLPGADRFMPKDVAMLPLDYNVLHDQSQLSTSELRAVVAKTAVHRSVIPITWAQHDDGNYVGRPYTPYESFCDKLDEMECAKSGFGIIHWTTKPLDLYFKSLVDQTWNSSKNESIESTCSRMADAMVGNKQSASMAAYLLDWINTMPKIGRETSDRFIDHELKDIDVVEEGFNRRNAILDRIDLSQLSPSEREWIDYYRGLERYILDIYRTEAAFNAAKKAYAAGDLESARKLIKGCHPEEVIEYYGRFSRRGGLSRGEQGLIVSMNTRWLPHYIKLRQQLGVEPIRMNFGPTSHDPLAQSRGIFTFYFDEKKNVWQTLGTEETGCRAVEIEANNNPTSDSTYSYKDSNTSTKTSATRSGIVVESPLTLTLSPMTSRNSRSAASDSAVLSPGLYRLGVVTNIEPCNIEISLSSQRSATYRFDPIHAKYLRLLCQGSDVNAWNSIEELRCDAIPASKPTALASRTAPGYEAEKAVDGNPKTRWAADGEASLQVELDAKRQFSSIGIDWYEGDSRNYKFTMQISNDGINWTEVQYTPEKENFVDISNKEGTAYTEDTSESNEATRILYIETHADIQLDQPESVTLAIVPEDKPVVVYALILKPVSVPVDEKIE